MPVFLRLLISSCLVARFDPSSSRFFRLPSFRSRRLYLGERDSEATRKYLAPVYVSRTIVVDSMEGKIKTTITEGEREPSERMNSFETYSRPSVSLLPAIDVKEKKTGMWNWVEENGNFDNFSYERNEIYKFISGWNVMAMNFLFVIILACWFYLFLY